MTQAVVIIFQPPASVCNKLNWLSFVARCQEFPIYKFNCLLLTWMLILFSEENVSEKAPHDPGITFEEIQIC